MIHPCGDQSLVDPIVGLDHQLRDQLFSIEDHSRFSMNAAVDTAVIVTARGVISSFFKQYRFGTTFNRGKRSASSRNTHADDNHIRADCFLDLGGRNLRNSPLWRADGFHASPCDPFREKYASRGGGNSHPRYGPFHEISSVDVLILFRVLFHCSVLPIS